MRNGKERENKRGSVKTKRGDAVEGGKRRGTMFVGTMVVVAKRVGLESDGWLESLLSHFLSVSLDRLHNFVGT